MNNGEQKLPLLSGFWLVVAIVALLFLSPAEAAFDVGGTLDGVNPIAEITFLEDAGKTLTIENVKETAWEEKFRPLPNGKTFFGITSSTYWLKLKVENSSNQATLWVLQPGHVQFDAVECYYYPDSGEPTVFHLGKNWTRKDYPLSGVGPAFPITSAPGETGTLYLKMAYNKTGLMLTQINLWSLAEFGHKTEKLMFLFALMSGGAIFMILYNLFLAYSLRLTEYAWYALFISSMTLAYWTSTGIGYKYIWTDNSYLAGNMPVITIVLALLVALKFSSVFLDTRHFLPKAHRILRYLGYTAAVALVVTLAGFRFVGLIASFASGILLALIPVLGVMAWRKGKKEARFYIVSFSFATATILLALLRNLGLYPIDSVSVMAPSFFFMLLVMFLSFALADRINILRTEKAKADKNALEHELALAKVLAEGKEELERKVALRTEELEVAKTTLTNTLKETQALIDSNPDIHYVFDTDGRLVKWNKGLEELCGLSHAEMKHRLAIDFICEADRAFTRATIKEIFKTGRINVEARLFSHDGTLVPYFCNGVALRNDNGKITGFTGTGRNISALKEKEIELRNAKTLAEDATKIKDKFISLVSHDLKGPLATIRGFLELSLDKTTTIEEIRRYAQHSVNVTDGLLNMISKLLDIGRLQAGTIIPEKRYFALWHLVALKIMKFQWLAENKNLVVVNAVPKDAKLFADEDLMGEVLLNLIGNAIKFTPGNGTITVALEGSRKISVKDTGHGISGILLPNIFRHDVKTTSQGTMGESGTGLGLPLCYDIVKAHGGYLTVETSASGTTFFVELPPNKPVVLIADDQEVHRMIMKEQISTIAQVEFAEAANGEEALSLLESVSPILLITDVNMPNMDGFELLSKIREHYSATELPVVVSTSISTSGGKGGTTGDARTVAFDYGANDFILKPIVPDEFIPRIRRYLP